MRVEEEVFKRAFIPRNLFEVIDAERDVNKVSMGETKEILYMHLTGLTTDKDASARAAKGTLEPQPEAAEEEAAEQEEEGDEDEDDDEDDDDDENG